MMPAMMKGRLTATGISIPNAPHAIPCWPFPRTREISFRSIVSVISHTSTEHLIKFVNAETSPHRLDEVLVSIPEDEETFCRNTPPYTDEPMNLAGFSGAPQGAPQTAPQGAPQTASSPSGSLGARIYQLAFANCSNPTTRKPILVIINPKSGPGHAEKLYFERSAPIFAEAGVHTKVVVTKTAGEAKQLARTVSMADHDTIVLVSGDGLPHEVINGLASRGADSRAALSHFGLAQLPGGSGNALSLALSNGEQDWAELTLSILKGRSEPFDLLAVSQGSNVFYSFLSQAYGVVADCDLGTEHLRWMGGSRFVFGLIYKFLRGQSYPCEIAYLEGPVESSDSELLARTVQDPIPAHWIRETHPKLSMFYVGKLDWMSADALMFPAADPLDGTMDMIMWDTSFGGIRSLVAFSSVGTGNHVRKIPFYRKVGAYRLTPLTSDKFLSIDGESYPLEPFEVSVIPKGVRYVR